MIGLFLSGVGLIIFSIIYQKGEYNNIKIGKITTDLHIGRNIGYFIIFGGLITFCVPFYTILYSITKYYDKDNDPHSLIKAAIILSFFLPIIPIFLYRWVIQETTDTPQR